MLTRSGVAKRLGKSIATVRRMEGNELHPVRNAQGVYMFDPGEVEIAAQATNRSERMPHRIADLVEWTHADSDDFDGQGLDAGNEEIAPDDIKGSRYWAERAQEDAETATRERRRLEELPAEQAAVDKRKFEKAEAGRREE